MTNAEATITENAASVAEQGAHVAPEKASSKKAPYRRRARPGARKPPRVGKPRHRILPRGRVRCASVGPAFWLHTQVALVT